MANEERFTTIVITSRNDGVRIDQTWILNAKQADLLPDLLDQLHQQPEALPSVLTPSGRPGQGVLVAKTLDAMEREYHAQKCGCAGYPRSCERFNITRGQTGPGAVVGMPIAWPVSEVLRVANAQAYARAAGAE